MFIFSCFCFYMQGRADGRRKEKRKWSKQYIPHINEKGLKPAQNLPPMPPINEAKPEPFKQRGEIIPWAPGDKEKFDT